MISNNTAGQKTERITDDSVKALLLFLLGVLIISMCLICIFKAVSNCGGYHRGQTSNNSSRKKSAIIRIPVGQDADVDSSQDIEVSTKNGKFLAS